MELGTITHLAILEPDLLEDTYQVIPDFGDKRYKSTKEKLAAWMEAEHDPSKRTVDAEHYDKALAMRAAVQRHPVASRLFTGGRPEVSFTWTDDATGIRCKGRQDYVVPGRYMVSVKSSRFVDPDGFGREAAKRLYNGAESWYSDGYAAATEGEVLPVTFVVVQNARPFDVAVYPFEPDAYESGVEMYRRCLDLLAECREKNEYPGCCPGTGHMNWPRWAFNRDDEDGDLGLVAGGTGF
jgi:exodeoxyribonuclease VIII